MKVYKVKSINRIKFYLNLCLGLVFLLIIVLFIGIIFPTIYKQQVIFFVIFLSLTIFVYNVLYRSAVKVTEIKMNSNKIIINDVEEIYFKDIETYHINLGISYFAKVVIESYENNKFTLLTRDKYGDFSEFAKKFEEIMIKKNWKK